MTAATSRLRRRGIGAGVAALVGLSGLGLSAAIPAQAVASFDLTRPADTSDRFATAASVATSAFTTSTNVIIANGDNAVDALSASYLAGTTTPILYVTSTSVPAATAAAITKLGATNAYVVGGTTAIPDSVVASLSTTTETRIAGADRYKTAVAVGQAKAAMGTKPTTAFIARGDQFADALAIAPVAAKSGVPILLTETGSLNADTLAALKAWGITSVTIVGGPSAVSENVVTSLTAQGVTSTRIAGSTRSSTATAIANTTAFGFAKTSVYVVNGFRPVDALPAAVAAAKANAPILLTEDGVLGADTQAYLTANAGTLTSGVAVGGTTVLPNTVETAAETAAQSVASNRSLAVTPADAATLSLVGDDDPNVATDDRVFGASGLTNGTTYRVTLVNSENITVGANGQVTFLASVDGASTTGFSANTGVAVDASDARASITSVNNGTPSNGAAAFTGQSAIIAPVNGSISFTIDGVDTGSVTPVLYVNGGTGGTATTGGTSPRLEVQATAAGQRGAATESFGLGGATTFVNPLAASGETGGLVDGVNKGTNQFDAGSLTYSYDSNDTFRIGSVPATFDEFEAALSSGDSVVAVYSATAAASSSFTLTDTNPGPPNAPTVSLANSNDVTISGTITGPVDSVEIQRATVPSSGTPVFTTIGTVTPTTGGAYTYADNDVPAGSYQYRVTATNDGDTSVPSTVTAQATTTPGPDVTAPAVIAGAGVQDVDGNFLNVLDAGDVFLLHFNEPITVAANAAIIVSDGTDSGTLTNGGNATFTTNAAPVAGLPAGSILTVTVNASVLEAPSNDVVGADSYTVSNRVGISDTAGNAWNLGGDITLEDNGPEFVADTAIAGSTTFSLVFNENLSKASAETLTNYAFTTNGTTSANVTSAVLSTDLRTVTLTVATAAAVGATVNPTGVVDTDGQASTQGATGVVPAS